MTLKTFKLFPAPGRRCILVTAEGATGTTKKLTAETISLGYALYPRFISYADGDLGDVTSVLRKLIAHNQSYAGTIQQ